MAHLYRPVRDLRAATRGAVMVEFLIAFLPVATFFLAIVQYCFLQSAAIITQFAAGKAVRAAVVVLHDDPAFYGDEDEGRPTGERLKAITRAAMVPLRTTGATADAVKLTFDSQAYGAHDLVGLTLEYTYRCKVPLARLLTCGASGVRTITAKTAMQNQGAEYEYDLLSL
jgi:hypothetical protein